MLAALFGRGTALTGPLPELGIAPCKDAVKPHLGGCSNWCELPGGLLCIQADDGVRCEAERAPSASPNDGLGGGADLLAFPSPCVSTLMGSETVPDVDQAPEEAPCVEGAVSLVGTEEEVRVDREPRRAEELLGVLGVDENNTPCCLSWELPRCLLPARPCDEGCLPLGEPRSGAPATSQDRACGEAPGRLEGV